MKTKYDPVDMPLLAEQYARDGLIDKEICAKLGICQQTFYEYKRVHPEFAEALKQGKQVTDAKVEQVLLKKCLGYPTVEVKVISYPPDESGNIRKRVERTTKQVPPDTVAIMFWKQNREPHKWRDRRNLAVTGPNGGPIQTQNETRNKIELAELNDHELDILIRLTERAEQSQANQESPGSGEDNGFSRGVPKTF